MQEEMKHIVQEDSYDASVSGEIDMEDTTNINATSDRTNSQVDNLRSPSQAGLSKIGLDFLDISKNNNAYLKWVYFTAYCLCSLVTGSLVGGIAPLLIVFEPNLNVSATQVSLVYTMCWVGYGIGSILGGFMVDNTRKTHQIHGISLCITGVLLGTMFYVKYLYIMSIYWLILGIVSGGSESIIVVLLCRIDNGNGTVLYAKLQIIYTIMVAVSAIFYKYSIAWNILAVISFVYAIITIFILPTPAPITSKQTALVKTVTTLEDEEGNAAAEQSGNKALGSVDQLKGEKMRLIINQSQTVIDSNSDNNDGINGINIVNSKSTCLSTIIDVFLPLALLCLYIGSRTSLAFVGFYCFSILDLPNGNKIGEEMILFYYYGLLLAKFLTPIMLARINSKKLIMLLSVPLLIVLIFMCLLQFAWNIDDLQFKISENFLVKSLYIIYAVNGFCTGPIYNVTFRLFECFREITGIVPTIILVAFSVGAALSGYGSGLVLNAIGYNMIPYYSSFWVAVQIILIIASIIALNKLEKTKIKMGISSQIIQTRRVMRYNSI